MCITQVACPSVNVSPATFTTAAAAAVSNYGATLSSSTTPTAFNPYQNLGHFWLAAFIFEDVGVTAYKGGVSVLAVRMLCNITSATMHAHKPVAKHSWTLCAGC